MKEQFLRALTMMTLLVVMSLAVAVVSANGQSSSRTMANVPFDFVVGNSELPAGQYRVESATSSGDALRITGQQQSVFHLSTTMNRLQIAKQSTLVFHRYGNKYFLAEIWVAGLSQGRQLQKSKSEKAVERELTAANKHKFERVEIVLAQR